MSPPASTRLPLTVDRDTRTVTVGGVELHCSPSEYEIIAFLDERRGRIVSRALLADVLYGASPDCDAPRSNVIVVLVSRVRRKLADGGASPLQRRWGRGYFLAASPPGAP